MFSNITYLIYILVIFFLLETLNKLIYVRIVVGLNLLRKSRVSQIFPLMLIEEILVALFIYAAIKSQSIRMKRKTGRNVNANRA